MQTLHCQYLQTLNKCEENVIGFPRILFNSNYYAPHFLEPEFDLVKNIKRNDYDRRYEISYGRGEGDGRMKICREADVSPPRVASWPENMTIWAFACREADVRPLRTASRHE